MIAFTCSRCQHALTRHDSEAGNRVACPSCGQGIRVPTTAHQKSIVLKGGPEPDPKEFARHTDRTSAGPRARTPQMEEPTNRSRLHGELEELVALNLRHEKASKKAAIVVAGLLLGPVFAFCGVTLFVVLVEEDMALIEARLRRDLDIPRLEEAFHRQTKEGFDRVNKDRPDLPYDERFKLYQARNDEAREALFRAEDQWLFQRSRVSERRSMRSILVLLLSLPVPLAGLLWWRRKRMATAANLLATAVSQFQAEHPDLVRSWGGSEALASSERVRQIQVHLRRHSD